MKRDMEKKEVDEEERYLRGGSRDTSPAVPHVRVISFRRMVMLVEVKREEEREKETKMQKRKREVGELPPGWQPRYIPSPVPHVRVISFLRMVMLV